MTTATPLPPYALQLRHLTKHFGAHAALQDFGLDIPRGSRMGIIGRSGAGKSTLATALFEELTARGEAVELLDGDAVRENLSKGLGFSREDRDTNVRRIAFVAGLLAKHGVTVLVSAISPYAETRREEERADHQEGGAPAERLREGGQQGQHDELPGGGCRSGATARAASSSKNGWGVTRGLRPLAIHRPTDPDADTWDGATTGTVTSCAARVRAASGRNPVALNECPSARAAAFRAGTRSS